MHITLETKTMDILMNTARSHGLNTTDAIELIINEYKRLKELNEGMTHATERVIE